MTMPARKSKPIAEASIAAFADTHRLRVVTDKGDGTPVIMGRDGHLYQFDGERLGVIYQSQSVGKANNRRRECEAAGFLIVQDGDTEFAATFIPSDLKQTRLAIRVAGAKVKRVLSESRIEQLRANCDRMARAKAASKVLVEGPLAA